MMAIEKSEHAVAVTRRIDAPAAAIFVALCDPQVHLAIDGSGMLRSTEAEALTKVGDRFVVEMWNDQMGDYEITNEVVDFVSDRLIRWQPTLSRTSREEHSDRVGVSAKHRWGYTLSPVSGNVTDVTETFDVIESPEWVRLATKGGETWIDAMTASLDRLAEHMRVG